MLLKKKYREDIQTFGMNMLFIEAKKAYFMSGEAFTRWNKWHIHSKKRISFNYTILSLADFMHLMTSYTLDSLRQKTNVA